MENQEKNEQLVEKELLDKLNNIILGYNKKISFSNFRDNNERYDIEILYCGKKITNFVEGFSNFCFIDNKVYIPCSLTIKNKKNLDYNILYILEEMGYDLFSIDNNNLIKQELSKELADIVSGNICFIGSDTTINLDYYQNRIISPSDINFITSSPYLWPDKNIKNLVYVNILHDLDRDFYNLLELDNKIKFDNGLKFNYDCADSAEYHSKFNELISKTKKINKSINIFVKDCVSFSNIKKDHNKYNKIHKSFKSLISKKLNKQEEKVSDNIYINSIPVTYTTGRITSNSTLNTNISYINNYINPTLTSDPNGMFAIINNNTINGLSSHLNTIGLPSITDINEDNQNIISILSTYIMNVCGIDLDHESDIRGIFDYFVRNNFTYSFAIRCTVLNRYFTNTILNIINDDEMWNLDDICVELTESIHRYVNEATNETVNEAESNNLPI